VDVQALTAITALLERAEAAERAVLSCQAEAMRAIDFISICAILLPILLEEITMIRLRYAELAHKPIDVLDMTSLTPEEFQILVPNVEQAFQTHLAEWRLDGKPRTARRFTT
jgi:hypothetical protein